MRLRRLPPAAAAVLALAPAAAAAPPPGGLRGTWSDPATGTTGQARLDLARAPLLRLDGAFGCVGATVLPVRYRGGRLSGAGADVPCNRGLRWSLRGTPASATVQIRLADGSRAVLVVSLRRR